MIQIFPSASRHVVDRGWLISRFSFSFAEYYDPNNMGFGPMRVLNDDTIRPGKGFGKHPHREMEIVTIVLEGELEHQDSMGQAEIIHPGEVQRMSAGTGIFHSEMNPSDTEEIRLLQLWFEPDEYGVEPSYEQFQYDRERMVNRLLPVVSNRGDFSERTASIHQDMTIYLSKLDEGETIQFTQQTDRRTFLFMLDGRIRVNEEAELQRRDSARMTDLLNVDLAALETSSFMLIDLP